MKTKDKIIELYEELVELLDDDGYFFNDEMRKILFKIILLKINLDNDNINDIISI